MLSRVSGRAQSATRGRAKRKRASVDALEALIAAGIVKIIPVGYEKEREGESNE